MSIKSVEQSMRLTDACKGRTIESIRIEAYCVPRHTEIIMTLDNGEEVRMQTCDVNITQLPSGAPVLSGS